MLRTPNKVFPRLIIFHLTAAFESPNTLEFLMTTEDNLINVVVDLTMTAVETFKKATFLLPKHLSTKQQQRCYALADIFDTEDA